MTSEHELPPNGEPSPSFPAEPTSTVSPHDVKAFQETARTLAMASAADSEGVLFEPRGNEAVEEGSTELLEKTVVADHEEGKDEDRMVEQIRSHNTKKSTDEEAAGDWHPLREQVEMDGKNANVQDDTVVVEEGDIVDSKEIELDVKPVKASERASHLHLNLKPPSPQPWDLVDPPDHHGKGAKDYSPDMQKFQTMQNAIHTRPLIPKSSYYFGPPPPDSAFGTPPVGQIGVHHPREVLRIERDYSGGEVIQFAPIYPLELEGRITPTQFLESINAINELLISAHSLRHAFLDNTLAVLSLQISKLFLKSYYEKQMERLQDLIEDLNVGLFNPVGLNILWPRNVAFLFLEIEYY